MRENRSIITISFCLIALCVLSGCGGGKKSWRPGEALSKEKIKIGMIYISDPVAEVSGYDYSHDQGITITRKELGLLDSQIIRKTNVGDTDPAEIENNIRDCVAAGANIIIATSWGYMDTCEKLAAEFPHVVFAHASGYKRNDTNFTNYFGRIYQARYLSGIIAGLKTTTGKIGYVAAKDKDNSEESASLNALALGVEAVNPNAVVYIKVTHSWYDPMEERNAARALIAEGCDVIAQGSDSPRSQIEAERAGVWGIGFNSDMSGDAPGAVMTSVIWRWEVYYTYLIRSVMDGSFTTAPYFGGLAEGIVDITPLSRELAPPAAAGVIEEARRAIVEEQFNVFDGVMETNDGRFVGIEGAALPDSEITGAINWYYRNVVEL
jgi:basic membrane protein A